jgi:hypothetical protein
MGGLGQAMKKLNEMIDLQKEKREELIQ